MEVKEGRVIEQQIKGRISNEIECDEMWHYLQNKDKKCWIWIAICRVTKLIIGFFTGSRGKKTGRQFYNQIKPFTSTQTKLYTDYWEAYTDFIPPNQHIQSKKETYTIEGYNASFRDDLQRLNRRTRAYSKQKANLDASLYLYIASHNEKQLRKLSMSI